MPIVEIRSRELAVCLVTYTVEAETVEEATEVIKTGTRRYDELEIINRDVEKILSADISIVH
jgi:hypothetical protein